MDAFIVIEGTSTGVVVARFATQADANLYAQTDNSLTAITGIKTMTTDELVGVAYYDGTTVHAEAPATSAEELASRRQTLYAHLRQAEKLGPLAVWSAARQNNATGSERSGVNDQDRYSSYGRWVEANTRAAMNDANLTDDRKYDVLLAECAIPGPTWYWLHRVDGGVIEGGWAALYGDNDRTQWVWCQTYGTTTTPNSRQGRIPFERHSTTVTAAGPAGASTIEVVSTEGFTATGTITMANNRSVVYTGKTATSFTGVTSAAAHVVDEVVYQDERFILTLDTTGDWVQALR